MNYSHDSNKRQNKKLNSVKKKRINKGKIMLFRIFFITIIICLFALVGAGFGIFMGIIKGTPDLTQLNLKPTTNYTSFIYDCNGNQIDTLSGGENRVYVTLDKIPKYLQEAFIALEDERFYEHNGIDLKGILRAVFVNIKNRSLSEGASTITQQLIKNNILTSEKKFTRKIQEQYLAIQYEKVYEKDLILEYYLNTISLGYGSNGVQAAANRYFNKDVSQLTLAESVVIACITQNPTKYNPITNAENNKEKCKIALDKMVEQGYITEAEKEKALSEDPYAKVQKTQQQYIEKSNHSYFVDAVVDDVIAKLQTKKAMSSEQANNLIYGGGLKIYTTQDLELQAIVDKYVNDSSFYPQASYELKINYSVTVKKANGEILNLGAEGIVKNEEGIEAFKKTKLESWGITSGDTIEEEIITKIPQPQVAFVIADQHTGHVKALSGGRGDKVGNRMFVRATQAKRQPGSTFKILAAYAPALDTGKLSPGSILIDEPYTIKLPGSTYTPKNWNGKFLGPTTVREAIYNSMNVLAVKTGQLVGIDTAFDYLRNFGFTTITATDKVASLPLGGLTDGVTPLELNAAYAAIANNGTYIEPILFTKVIDKDGNVLLDNTDPSQINTHTVIKESTALLLTDMMQDVIIRGTGSRLRSTFSTMPVAGKTGTTTDDKDLLFSGYTPYYTATVWTGHDTPKRLRYGYSYHLDIWGNIMRDVHEGLEYKKFPKVNVSESGMAEAKICTLSGLLATELCEQDPNHVVKSEFFNKGDIPKDPCNMHIKVRICNESHKIATEFCPADRVTEKSITKQKGETETPGLPAETCDIHTSPSSSIPWPSDSFDDEWVDPWTRDPDSNWPPSDSNPPSYPSNPGNNNTTEGTTTEDDIDNFFVPQN